MSLPTPAARARVPTNLITGLLGAGKTSLIRALAAGRPAGSRWAVLVNELGALGIDGALIEAGAGDLVVREVAGGCICCSAQVGLRVALTRLLRDARPDRLLIEPTGLGHPAGIHRVLAEPELARVLDLGATVCVVDPRQWVDPRFAASATARDQVAAADVLVVGKADLAGRAVTDRVLAEARAVWPPKLAVVEALHGAIDVSLLDLRSRAPGPDPRTFAAVTAGVAADKGGVTTRGWRFDDPVTFDHRTLRAGLEPLVTGGGFLRAKGVFRTVRGARALNYAGDAFDWQDIEWCRDSRFELIAAPATTPPWAAIEAALIAARVEPAVVLADER